MSALGPLLSAASFAWWVAGGWAIDLFVGRHTRRHGDLDVQVLRRDQGAVRKRLRDWDLHAADPPGSLRPWPVGETLGAHVHDVWCRETRTSPWAFQLMLADIDDTTSRWLFRRDTRISVPLSQLGLRSPDGIPYVAPEIQLLYKSREPIQPKDEHDFALALPLLASHQKQWLAAALTLTQPDHPWLRRLATVSGSSVNPPGMLITEESAR